MPRPSNTQQRRDEIVQALLSVMANQGYAKATVQAIAKQAGLRPGLIHYHFKTKQEILVALVSHLSDKGMERFETLLSQATTAEEKLKAFIHAWLGKGNDARPELVAAWVVIGTEAIRQQEVQEVYEKAINQQKTILKQLIQDIASERLSRRDIEDITSITLAAIEGAFKLSVATKTAMPDGYAAKSLEKLLLTYLEKK